MKPLLAISLIGLLLLSGCDKDKDPTRNAKLPAATQEGKNTVGFTLEDGQVWVPYYECALLDDPCGKASVNVSPLANTQRRIGLSFSKYVKDKSDFLSIRNNRTSSVNSTGEKIDSLTVTFVTDGSPWTEYAFPQPGSSFLITRFDRKNQIISGTFHFILKESSGSRTITLSNGRFDYKFGACECD
ncbi:hypothetical protein [Rufibacter sp. XAAS-G3-1]|uniref:hypothetical protein n=1 Tax=Rufibacter sp. XAAS-G3-1 TaxID=2729134 RepID=UPI0015E77D0B|nr:hypothetical protein [Rufibacter sp. XAAS-G3-1]